MFKKLLIFLFFIFITPKLLIANDVTELFDQGSYDKAFRSGYAEALSGDPENSFIIGKILINGKGSAKKNISKGLEFISFAAEGNLKTAVVFLAKNYEEGTYSSVSKRKALKYYEQCEKLGGSSKCSKKVTQLRIASSGAISKKSCVRYNKKDKKIANKIGKCIVAGHLDGNASSYFFISFDKGNNDAFISAARRILKDKSKSNLMKIIVRIPKFDKKASKKQLKKFTNLLIDYGYSSGECGTAKNSLGFASKGNVPSCVLAATAGDQKAQTKAAIYWRDGLHGLPKSKRYFKKMIANAQEGGEADIAGILEVLKSDPREHFIKAKQYLNDNPMNVKLVSKAFKLELELLALQEHVAFASKTQDVADVIEIVDWSNIDKKLLGRFVYFYVQELSSIDRLNTPRVKKNINKIPFSEEMFVELLKQGSGAGETAYKFIETKIFKDCNAFDYILKNEGVIDIKIVQSAQKSMFKKCKQSGLKVRSMKALLQDALIDLESVKVPIEVLLNDRLACKQYSDFLEYSDLEVPAEYFNVNFKKLNKQCSKFGIVSYSLAKIAYSKKEYDKAYKYSNKSCMSDQSIGCELIASMIRDNKSSSASQFSYNDRDGAAISLLERGHKAGDIKSTAMLFDIFDQSFSAIGNTKRALTLLEDLKKSETLPAEIRVKAECFNNRKLDLLKFVTQNCKAVCSWAKTTLSNKTFDQGSSAALKEILKKATCNPSQ